MSTARALPTLTHLDELEAEAIHILREVAAELERPVLLFSGGKDSIVLLRLDTSGRTPSESAAVVLARLEELGLVEAEVAR